MAKPTHPKSKKTTRKPLEKKKDLATRKKGKETSSSAEESEGSSGEESSSSSEDDSRSESESPVSEPEPPKKTKSKQVSKPTKHEKQEPPKKKAVDLLLDLDDIAMPMSAGQTPIYPTALGSSILTPSVGMSGGGVIKSGGVMLPPLFSPIYTPVHIPTKQQELVNSITGSGMTVAYRFTRNPHLYSPKMVSIELLFTNATDEEIKNIRTGNQNLALGMEMHTMPDIESLAPKATSSATIGIDFNDTTQAANFEICSSTVRCNVSIPAPIGELLQPITLGENEFVMQQNKLKGLNENVVTCELNPKYNSATVLCARVHEVANVVQVPPTDPSTNLHRFAAQTLSSKVLVLLSVRPLDNGKAGLVVNCEKMVIGSMLLKEIKLALNQ